MRGTDGPADYVVATGVAHSVRDFVAAAFAHAGIDDWDARAVDESLVRPADPAVLCRRPQRGPRRARLAPSIGFEALVGRLVDAEDTWS